MIENDQQLSYKDVLILAKGCYDLALEDYAMVRASWRHLVVFTLLYGGFV